MIYLPQTESIAKGKNKQPRNMTRAMILRSSEENNDVPMFFIMFKFLNLCLVLNCNDIGNWSHIRNIHIYFDICIFCYSISFLIRSLIKIPNHILQTNQKWHISYKWQNYRFSFHLYIHNWRESDCLLVRTLDFY